ncbi:MAG: hypothetical protein IPI06_03845 [Gammaproteobacteria bacterium]|nr:hypothetical protein [Gammaproteobacteria bacterium]
MSLPDIRPVAWAALAAVLALAGCGERATDRAPAGKAAARGAAAARAARPATPAADQDMVAAVAAGGGGGLVALRFRLAQRPVAGQPVDMDVMVTAVSPVNRIRVLFQGGDGFEIRAGQELGPIQRPEVGRGFVHRITLVPRRDGIFQVSAVALVEQASGEELARTYSIPIIAGAGLGGVATAAH